MKSILTMALFNDFLLDDSEISNPFKVNSNNIVLDPCKQRDPEHVNLSAESFIDDNYDKITLDHIKRVIISDINKVMNPKNTLTYVYLIDSYNEQIYSLKSEKYFWENKLKEKNDWLKSLVTKVFNNKNKDLYHSNQFSLSKVIEDLQSSRYKDDFINKIPASNGSPPTSQNSSIDDLLHFDGIINKSNKDDQNQDDYNKDSDTKRNNSNIIDYDKDIIFNSSKVKINS